MSNNTDTRRDFLRKSLLTAASVSLYPLLSKADFSLAKAPLFKISLGQWSLHRATKSGKISTLDFPAIAKKTYGVDGVEYVNQLFMDKAKDKVYLKELKKRADDNGVKNLVLMVDLEGEIGNPNQNKRNQAVENHYKWLDAAKLIGCHSLRVNAFSEGSFEDQLNYTSEGLRKLAEYAADRKMNVIIENHGGMSSRGDWLTALMKKVNLPNVGTMPDFDNFQISEGNRYDRYKGMQELMPWAKSVSTKAHDFDEHGNETTIDFKRMMKIVTDAGYHGYVSAEYEGERLSEDEGIKATIRLMERVRDELKS